MLLQEYFILGLTRQNNLNHTSQTKWYVINTGTGTATEKTNLRTGFRPYINFKQKIQAYSMSACQQ